MIFSVKDHIEQIKKGTKTQTRRKSGSYVVGKTYSIQPSRTSKGIPEGRILITRKKEEYRGIRGIDINYDISYWDAECEGGYHPQRFEELYDKMYPKWKKRWAYTFKFIPNEVI